MRYHPHYDFFGRWQATSSTRVEQPGSDRAGTVSNVL
jgi:hypothetical protein